MKKYFLVFAFLASSMLGCSTINQSGGFFIESIMADCQYGKNGFWIEGYQKKLVFDARKNRETLKLKDDRLNEVVLIDQGCDGKVDEIKLNNNSTYLRGDDRTKELFEMADEVFLRVRNGLGVDSMKAHWKTLDPADIGGANGLTNL
ncbi:MAG: hypothetical protein D6785_03585 [Planctomycetota bacterium]|nr:MAG: hypothetical protein D6785_03585 [Planctomycetota bacterium]